MSLFSSKSQSVFRSAERMSLSPHDDVPDPLEYKPMGWCPWCGTKLMKSSETEWTGHPFCPKLWCEGYDSITDEQSNRERYARQIEKKSSHLYDL